MEKILECPNPKVWFDENDCVIKLERCFMMTIKDDSFIVIKTIIQEKGFFYISCSDKYNYCSHSKREIPLLQMEILTRNLFCAKNREEITKLIDKEETWNNLEFAN